MIGQSEVQTGSRKVSTTVRPVSEARETEWPLESVRVKGGAGASTKVGGPSAASIRIGSALGLVAATAMGAAPTSTMTTANAARRAAAGRWD